MVTKEIIDSIASPRALREWHQVRSGERGESTSVSGFAGPQGKGYSQQSDKVERPEDDESSSTYMVVEGLLEGCVETCVPQR